MEHLSTVKEELDHEQITNETLAIVKVSSPECIQVESVLPTFFFSFSIGETNGIICSALKQELF
jgi:hypothetical protein